MKIGFYFGAIQNAEIGGGFTFQKSIMNPLMESESNHEFIFYYRNSKNRCLFKDTQKVKFVNLEFEKRRYKLFIKKKKRQAFRENEFNNRAQKDGIDLVYFVMPFYEKVDIPFIFTVWDLAHRACTFFPEVSINNEYLNREAWHSMVIPKAAYTVIGNNAGRNQVCRYYNIDESRVKTIPMPTPDYVYTQKPDDAILQKYSLEKDKYLFYPAQFWPHKNHIRLIKAIKKLKEQVYDFKMVFTGSDKGNVEYLKKKIAEYNLDSNVVFAGFVTEPELICLYKNAYALTYASFFGPDNIPPLEAMALGCPVIAANTEGFEEQLGNAALYFDKLNEDELIDRLKQLENSKIRQDLINNGIKLASQYSAKNYVDKMLKIIDKFEPIRECWD